MTAPKAKRGFVSRPGDPEAWVRAPERSGDRAIVEEHSARLTIDVTPALRGRIKIVAFQRGLTVAEMVRDLLAREYAENNETAP